METLKFKNIRINSKIVEITIQKSFPNNVIIIDSHLGKQRYIDYTVKESISKYKQTYTK